MSFAVSGDWQLQDRAWRGRPDLSGDSYFGLRQVVSHCLNNNLPLLCLGDLTDSDRPDAYTVGVLARQVAHMEADRIPIWYVLGNHDPASRLGGDWLQAVSDWPHHLGPGCSVGIGGNKLYGIDYMPPDLFQKTLSDMLQTQVRDGKCILAAHQMWAGLTTGGVTSRGCRFDWLEGVDLLLTGDLHYTVIKDVNIGSKPLKVASPGSLCMQDITEPEQKNFLIVNDDLEVETVPIRSRKVIRLQVGTKEHLAEFMELLPQALEVDESLPEELRKPIMDIYLLADVPNIRRLLTHAVGGRGHLFFRDRFDTATNVVRKVVQDGRVVGNTDLIEALAEDLDINNVEPVSADMDEVRSAERQYHIGSELLRATNPASKLDDLEHELLSQPR